MFFTGDGHKWVQTIGIVAAGAFALYTFVYKDIFLVEIAPRNLTLDIHLRQLSPQGAEAAQEVALIAIELTASASNSSTRTAYLLPNVWSVYGETVTPQDNPVFAREASGALMTDAMYAESEANVQRVATIAVGRLFPDTRLKPGEKIMRTLIFHVAACRYQQIQMVVVVPSTAKEGRLFGQWSFDATKGDPTPAVYRIHAKGRLEALPRNSDGTFVDSDASDELIESESATQLYLNSTPATKTGASPCRITPK